MNILEYVDLGKDNSFRLRSSCRYYLELHDVETVQALHGSEFFRSLEQVLVIGAASNLVLPEFFPGLVLRPLFKGMCLEYEDEEKVLLSVGAGEDWQALIDYCLEKHYFGLENLTLIPGKVGAAPIQNIGAYGVEVESCIDSVDVFDFETGAVRKLDHGYCDFAYRDSIFKREPGRFLVMAVNFLLSKQAKLDCSYNSIQDYLHEQQIDEGALEQGQLASIIASIRRSRLPDPGQVANVGSFFKNPIVDEAHAERLRHDYPELPVYAMEAGFCKLSAAWLIECCQLKGLSKGAVRVSGQHALVLENHGEANQQDVLALAAMVQEKVAERFSLMLDIEPIVVAGASASGIVARQ